MKKVDLLTPLGIALGFMAITFAVTQIAGLDHALGFISIASFLTVVGGIIASTLVHFSVSQLKLTLVVVKEAFYRKEYRVDELIKTFVHFSSVARKNGMIAIERELEYTDEPLLEKGLLLSIDGTEQETIRDIMTAEVLAAEERQARGRRAIEKAGDFAPAWGMIGTIVGLVLMLQTLESPEALGPKMAIALVTTFYGTVLANLVFIPLAGKMETLAEQESFYKQIMIEGVIGIHSGYSPKMLEEKLSVFLALEHSRRSEERVPNGREGVHANKTT